MKTKLRSLLLAPLILAAPATQAAVVINNLTGGTQAYSESLSGPDGVDDFGDPYNDHEIAFSFTTGTTTVNLTEIAFLAFVVGGSTSPIQLSLSTGTTAPGGTNPLVLGSVTPSGPAFYQTLALTPSSLVTLAANTQYWVHFTVPAGPDIYTIPNANLPVVDPEWTLGTTLRSDPFTAWEEINTILHPRVRITVDAVPEPSALLLGGCASLCLIARRKRIHA